MKQYLDMLRYVLEHGRPKPDRTGTGTLSVFGYQTRCDLTQGFPLLTTKKLHVKSIIYELLWFLRGETNVKYLREHGVKIWDEWADENGELGPIYGYQWRSWPTPVFVEGHPGIHYDWESERIELRPTDQIAQVIDTIKRDPSSRRHIVSAWNVADLPRMALLPCHVLFQFYVNEGRLSCQLYMRSADLFLGVPFNIASYALLTMMVAHVTGLEPFELVHTFGDLHLYANHLEQAREQLAREARPLPTLRFGRNVPSMDEFIFEDFALENYNPHPHIPAPIAV